MGGNCISAIVKIYSLSVVPATVDKSVLISLWHIHVYGSGSGAPRKCRLLWLTVLFLCPAMYHTSRRHRLTSKSLKVSFLKVFSFRCQVVANGCSGSLLSGPTKRCEHIFHLGKLIHDLLVDQ